jgi:hypothetical protein
VRTHGWAWAVWLLFALGAFACGEDDGNPTDVYVSFKSDLSLGSELSAVRVRVYRVTDSVATGSPVSEHTISAADLGKRLPLVIEKRQAADFLLAAQALGPGGVGDPQIERLVKVRFLEGQSISLQVFLGRVCQRKACTAVSGETCYGEAHGAICQGSCGVIDGPDNLPAWSVARADWQPTSCGQPGGLIDGGVSPTDAGSGNTAQPSLDAATVDGALADGGTCTPSAPSASCNTVSQCGCAPGMSCGIVSLSGTSLQLGCVTPGTLPVGSACTLETCLPGNTCVGSLCRPFCAKDADCGSGGHCIAAVTNETTNAKPIPGLSACFNGCGADGDCSTGCCRALPGSSEAGKVCLTAAACCAQAGSSCATSADCCGGALNQAVCVSEAAGGAICRATCSANTDCQSGCCAPLEGGGSACFAASQCRPGCAEANAACQSNADCCGGPGGTAVCVDQGRGPICADRCAANVECFSNCCAPLQAGGNVCAPSNYCP